MGTVCDNFTPNPHAHTVICIVECRQKIKKEKKIFIIEPKENYKYPYYILM